MEVKRFFTDDNGNITLVQGDNGELVVTGLPTDKNYTLYFNIYDENRKFIGSEVFVNTNKNETATLVISASLTDYMNVKKEDDFAIYYYGLKLCYPDEGIEDTLLIGNSNLGDLNTITVYPKKVEGTV